MHYVLSPLRRGKLDPTFHQLSEDLIWRGVQTPLGAATVRVQQDAEAVRGQAWGPGAEWVLESLPRLLGADDDPGEFQPQHRALQRLQKKYAGLRLGATGLVMESLIPAILEQKVTSREAHQSFRHLVIDHGEPAPGPGADHGLWVQPSPDRLRTITSWEWTQLGVGPTRAATLARVLGQTSLIERASSMSPADLDRRLTAISGVGVWTSAETRARSHGDADAVSFGDFHLSRNIGWALVGEPVDDDGLEEILSPYVGNRLRVQRLVEIAGIRLPRRGPRRTLPNHLPGL
jgi:3-methyladenine DNA glycosylase/8-oxoguanine DNA glycosylase